MGTIVVFANGNKPPQTIGAFSAILDCRAVHADTTRTIGLHTYPSPKETE